MTRPATATIGSSAPVACVAEDRRTMEPSLRILIASLERHSPSVKVELFVPDPTPEFSSWLAGRRNVRLNVAPIEWAQRKYDIKPVAMGALLGAGFDHIVWIDSDILVCRDIAPLFASLPDDVVAVGEECLGDGHEDVDHFRARAWGFEPGRAAPFALNSGVVRITSRHAGLIAAWDELLSRADYRAAQKLDWSERPRHLMGDQDVLCALLTSASLAAYPHFYLRRGEHIIQFWKSTGYTVAERLHHLVTGMPYFVHSQGFRPWWPPGEPPRSGSERFNSLYQQLSPYTCAARRYTNELSDASWLRARTPLVAALRGLGFGVAPLVGAPLAVAADVARLAKRARRALQSKSSRS